MAGNFMNQFFSGAAVPASPPADAPADAPSAPLPAAEDPAERIRKNEQLILQLKQREVRPDPKRGIHRRRGESTASAGNSPLRGRERGPRAPPARAPAP